MGEATKVGGRQAQQTRESQTAQMDAEVVRIATATVNLLEGAIEDARKAFQNLRLLSNLTFSFGLGLFVLAGLSGLVLQRETFSFLFGGLGIVTIVTIFLMKPKDEIQIALGNLLQAQVIWLNFYDQLHFWAPFSADGNLEQRKVASAALTEAARFALDALQNYVEPSQLPDKKLVLAEKR